MLTTSSATASARDCVPFNETYLQNHMCNLILTKRDGTPVDVTSVMEQDIIEICIRLGQTHPMGVLHFSVMESVVLFQLVDEMQHATHGAIKAMVLHEEAIAIRTSAPSETHMRAYITAVDGKPSRTQAPPLEGEGEPHSPIKNPYLGGEAPHHYQADLGDLADQELHQLMEDLHREVALHVLNEPPRSPPQTPWGNPAGSGDPDADDQEVTFPRGGWQVP